MSQIILGGGRLKPLAQQIWLKDDWPELTTSKLGMKQKDDAGL